MNVGEALFRGRKALSGVSESAPSDVRLLLADTLNQPTAWILANPEREVPANEAETFLGRLTRCAAGEPLPYVLGWWEFYGRRFAVGPDVLIPRPETEMLVETALDAIRRRNPRRLIDVGTGSGCVAITLAAEVEGLNVYASDVSRAALRTARVNARAQAVEERIRFVQADLLAGIRGPWDIICANLPYVPASRLRSGRHEPDLALDGGAHGTALTRRLVSALAHALAPSGTAILEIDDGQASELEAVAQQSLADARCRVVRDLAGFERFLVIERDS